MPGEGLRRRWGRTRFQAPRARRRWPLAAAASCAAGSRALCEAQDRKAEQRQGGAARQAAPRTAKTPPARPRPTAVTPPAQHPAPNAIAGAAGRARGGAPEQHVTHAGAAAKPTPCVHPQPPAPPHRRPSARRRRAVSGFRRRRPVARRSNERESVDPKHPARAGGAPHRSPIPGPRATSAKPRGRAPGRLPRRPDTVAVAKRCQGRTRGRMALPRAAARRA